MPQQTPPNNPVQPPPPASAGSAPADPGSATPGISAGSPPANPPGHPGNPHDPSAIDLLYTQLLDVRKVLDQLAQQSEADRARRKHEYVPVRASDLMRGFQAAVARANRAVVAGELEGQDIEDMAVRDLRVSISAPVIDSGHAEDPTLMLPNIKSVDEQSARISLEFSVMSVPRKAQG